jgi:hypothetical protein
LILEKEVIAATLPPLYASQNTKFKSPEYASMSQMTKIFISFDGLSFSKIQSKKSEDLS